MESNQPQKPIYPPVKHTIGKTTFIISRTFNPTAKESAETKMKRIIQSEAAQLVKREK